MPLNEEEKLHGTVLRRLCVRLSDEHPAAFFRIEQGDSRSAYRLVVALPVENRVVSIGMFIKCSRKRRSPWRYTFMREHQEEMKALRERSDHKFLIFIAGDDGIVCLSARDVEEILDHNFEDAEWVSVSRKLNENYRISGHDGSLERAIARTSFPKTIIDAIATAPSEAVDV